MSAVQDLGDGLGNMSVIDEDDPNGVDVDEALGTLIEEAQNDEHANGQLPRDVDDQVYDALPPELYVGHYFAFRICGC